MAFNYIDPRLWGYTDNFYMIQLVSQRERERENYVYFMGTGNQGINNHKSRMVQELNRTDFGMWVVLKMQGFHMIHLPKYTYIFL